MKESLEQTFSLKEETSKYIRIKKIFSRAREHSWAHSLLLSSGEPHPPTASKEPPTSPNISLHSASVLVMCFDGFYFLKIGNSERRANSLFSRTASNPEHPTLQSSRVDMYLQVIDLTNVCSQQSAFNLLGRCWHNIKRMKWDKFNGNAAPRSEWQQYLLCKDLQALRQIKLEQEWAHAFLCLLSWQKVIYFTTLIT